MFEFCLLSFNRSQSFVPFHQLQMLIISILEPLSSGVNRRMCENAMWSRRNLFGKVATLDLLVDFEDDNDEKH